jgi:hypothetical protein
MQGASPGVDANTVANATVACKFRLKSCDCGAGCKGTLIKHMLYGIVNFGADRRVLAPEIDERDGVASRTHRSPLHLAQDSSRVTGHDSS